MRSRFTYYSWIAWGITFVIFITMIFDVVMKIEMFGSNMPIVFEIYFLLCIGWLLILLIFGELRSKVTVVEISADSITKRAFGGLGLKREYFFNEIDGYCKSYISSKFGTYEYLYIIINKKKVVKLSQFYHANFRELKVSLLKKDIKYLGAEKWSLLTETKEIFT